MAAVDVGDSSSDGGGEAAYLALLQRVLAEGELRPDRTGTGALSVFGAQLRFDLSGGAVPAVTTKALAWRACIKELLWFLRGSTDATELQRQGVRIWDGNSSRAFLDARGLGRLPEGDIGAGYGFQWRHFGATYRTCKDGYAGQGVDQLAGVIDALKRDPFSRRIFLSAWNPAALPDMALPPCHVSAQLYVSRGPAPAASAEEEAEAAPRPPASLRLSCHMYQRSVDCFLGLPFNILSYAVLTHLLAEWCGMEAHELIISTGDTHVYANHVEAVREQLTRQPLAAPKLRLAPAVRSKAPEELVVEDFELVGYQCHPAIRAPMAV